MSRIKTTIRLLHSRRHPDQIAREVEAELRFHIEMRARANIAGGMKPDEAHLAARQSFGDFDQVKVRCCEISRSLPFDTRALKMGVYISIAILAGGAALWAVNMPHANFTGVLWQLVAIAVLSCSFIVGRRSRSTHRPRGDRASEAWITESERRCEVKVLHGDICEQSSDDLV